MAIPKKSEKDYFTYANYKHWSDNERWEIIDGEAFDMSPAHGMTHQRILVEISRQIANYLEDKSCQVFPAPFDVFLPESNESEDEISTIVQPDISIICDNSKLSEKGCTGASDVVIEIISPSRGAGDQIIKMSKPSIFDQNGKPSFNLFPDLQLIYTKYLEQRMMKL